MIDWLIDWLSKWLMDWLIKWMTERLVDLLIDRFIKQFNDWKVEWLIDSLTDWPISWPFDRIIGRLYQIRYIMVSNTIINENMNKHKNPITCFIERKDCTYLVHVNVNSRNIFISSNKSFIFWWLLESERDHKPTENLNVTWICKTKNTSF